MTTAQVVETSVTVNNNSPIQDYVHPDDQTQPTFEKNTVNKIEDNEPENLTKKLLLTDYTKVKKNKEQNGGNHTQNMTAILFRHLNEQGYKFSMITKGISSHVRYLLEEKGVRLLSLSLLWSEDLY